MNIEEIGFIIIVGVLIVMYFVMIRPMQQEQKRHQQTIRDLHVGDEVLTTSGFFARIKRIETPEEGPVQITLDLGNGLEVRAVTSAITRRLNAAAESAPQPEEAKGT